MKKILMVFIALTFFLVPMSAIAGEGPMKMPAGANEDANKHNEEGIMHWGEGHYDVALKHFQAASKAGGTGETHFNEAICLDKLGKHGGRHHALQGGKKER